MLNPEVQNAYISILKEELVPATGCTEPIALAYAAARMRAILGAAPERIVAEVSGNIIKNVKSVVVPNTGGRKGIQAAIAAGVVSGKAEKILQVISGVPASDHPAIAAYAQNTRGLLPQTKLANAVHQVRRGVSLNFVKDHVVQTRVFQRLGNGVKHAKLNQNLLRDYQDLAAAALLNLFADSGCQAYAAV